MNLSIVLCRPLPHILIYIYNVLNFFDTFSCMSTARRHTFGSKTATDHKMWYDVVAIGVAVVLVVALHTCTHATVATYLQNERSRSLVYTEKEIKIIYGVPFSLPYSLESHFLSHIHTHTQNIISLPCVRVQPIWCPYVALCYWSVASSSTYTLLHIVFV